MLESLGMQASVRLNEGYADTMTGFQGQARSPKSDYIAHILTHALLGPHKDMAGMYACPPHRRRR